MVSPLSWLIALGAVGVVAEATACSPVVEDMDYPGNDVAQTNRANHANCCNDCTKTAGCNLYVWTSWNGGTCFLNARISPVQQTQCSQVVDGVDYPGNDLAETNRANHADCCNDCAATPGCAAYVWTTYNDGTCFLKSKASKAQAVQGAKAALWTPLTAPPTLECSDVVDGVDYPGNDLSETSRTNYADCCNDCVATSGCAAYVWTDYNDGTCFLKSKAGKSQAVPGAKAAVRTTTTSPPPTNPKCSAVVDGVDYPGNDLAETSRANYADCCKDCAVTTGCAAYVWTSLNGGTCFLKSKAGEAQPVPGAKAATWAPLTTAPTTSSPVVTTPAPTPVATRSVVCLETVKGYDSWIPVTIDSNGDVATYGPFGKSYAECMVPRDWPYVQLEVSCGCDFKTKYPEFGSIGYDFGADFWCHTGKAYFNAQPPNRTCAPITVPTPYPTPRPKPTPQQTSTPPPLKCFNATKDVKFAGINISETNRAIHTDCCNDCADTLGCSLYVWTPSNGGTCYLKSKPKKSDTSSGNEPYPGAWSAQVLSEFRKQPIPPPEFRQCSQPWSSNYPCNDIALTNQTNFMDCCGDCTSTPNCVGYVWKDDVCFLKSKFDNFQVDEDAKCADVRRCTIFQMDKTFVGGDIMNVTAKREVCCRLSTKTKGCTRFSHFGGNCYLKNGDLAIKYTRLGAASATVY
ncbi:hypothetical protein Ae201684P_021162 [Aphanomyces euteiches]|uniref:Apple domain-containing protein n=1 Tax=Aphanomyces euteiches TaxID=100861 RepID=A0A6G0WGW8_9STRA|nr:hypothetical protein Ae201684_015346 [Aphanomyces euteiches]KAH9072025.1 hypothetical protein Ae201684P_021162 [Aphanomyces euteiches]KAH9153255.1 hypothetical protein AeRB84_004459 [Aphanomyces euteiches]